MKKQIIIAVFNLLFVFMSYTGNWQQILNKYQNVMTPEEKTFFSMVQTKFAAGEMPVIAASEIKAIPISENNEELVDLREPFFQKNRIQMLQNPSKPFEGPLYNAGFPESSKMRKNVLSRFIAMLLQLDHLAESFGYKKNQISIKVFEGLRDIKTQEMLFNTKVKQLREKNPTLTPEAAETEAAKWVSPVKDNVPPHSAGAAVDFSLWDETNQKPVNLGVLGTIWEHNPGPETFSEHTTEEQKKNRLYLLVAAHRAGLVNYFHEFWHYSAGDRWAAYWQQREYAVYDIVRN